MTNLKIFGIVFLLSVTVFVIVCIVGVNSRLTDKTINNETIIDIKKVALILRNARKEIKQPNGAPWLPDGYGYINTVEQVDRLFAFLPTDKKQMIKGLFVNKEVTDIDLGKLCIRFTRSSDWNSFYTKSNEIMLMVYDESPDCYCKAIKPDGIENVTSENMGAGWYKVYLVQRLGWFGA